jgi:hypothetical protein
MSVFDMAREGLRLELPAAVRVAQYSQETVVRRGLKVRTNGSFEPVTLTVKPLKEPEPLRGLLLLTFQIEQQPPGAPDPARSAEATDERGAGAAQQHALTQSNDDMQNLLSSVSVATVFVDPELNVKRFTAPA